MSALAVCNRNGTHNHPYTSNTTTLHCDAVTCARNIRLPQCIKATCIYQASAHGLMEVASFVRLLWPCNTAHKMQLHCTLLIIIKILLSYVYIALTNREFLQRKRLPMRQKTHGSLHLSEYHEITGIIKLKRNRTRHKTHKKYNKV